MILNLGSVSFEIWEWFWTGVYSYVWRGVPRWALCTEQNGDVVFFAKQAPGGNGRLFDMFEGLT